MRQHKKLNQKEEADLHIHAGTHNQRKISLGGLLKGDGHIMFSSKVLRKVNNSVHQFAIHTVTTHACGIVLHNR